MLLMQILIGFGVGLCSVFFLMSNKTFLDTLVNMGALMIINEFDDMSGKLFLMYIQTFYHEILENENFMVFDVEKRNLQTAYYYVTFYNIFF